MTYIFAIFLLITLGWLVYWVMVRPLILDSVEDEISRMTFQLKWSFIRDEPGAQSEAAQRLLKNLKMSKIVRYISFSQAVFFNLQRRSEIKAVAAKERATFENAPSWIRDGWQRHNMLAVKAALANSPTWWLPLSLLLLASVFSRQAEQWWNEARTAAANKLLVDCPA